MLCPPRASVTMRESGYSLCPGQGSRCTLCVSPGQGYIDNCVLGKAPGVHCLSRTGLHRQLCPGQGKAPGVHCVSLQDRAT